MSKLSILVDSNFQAKYLLHYEIVEKYLLDWDCSFGSYWTGTNKRKQKNRNESDSVFCIIRSQWISVTFSNISKIKIYKHAKMLYHAILVW